MAYAKSRSSEIRKMVAGVGWSIANVIRSTEKLINNLKLFEGYCIANQEAFYWQLQPFHGADNLLKQPQTLVVLTRVLKWVILQGRL